MELEILLLAALIVGSFLTGLLVMKYTIKKELEKILQEKDKKDLKSLLKSG
jgi:hypothetical protein